MPEPRAVDARVLVETRLVAGLPGPERADRLKALIKQAPRAARISAILEGMAVDGTVELVSQPNLHVHVLAPGCVCCIGNLTLRVTLARVLQRESPDMLLLAIADTRHLNAVENMLRNPPYGSLLKINGVFDTART